MKTAFICAIADEICSEHGNLSECKGFDDLYISGIGKANAAFTLSKVISDGYDGVINIGTCASRSIQVGSICMPRHFIEHDFDCTPLGFDKGFIPFEGNSSNIVTSSIPLHMLVNGMIQKLDPSCTLHSSSFIASGDIFVTDWDPILKTHHEIELIDMESAPMARLCAKNDIPFCSIKIVSDMASSASHLDWAKFVEDTGRPILHKIYQHIKKELRNAQRQIVGTCTNIS